MQIFTSQNFLRTKYMWSIGCDNITTEFSGLQIDKSLNWKAHNEYIK
jgi:hypothetical protein